MLIKLKQAVIVEGKYDKIKLSSIIDALIIPTNGFSIFKDKQTRLLIRTLAEKNGIVVVTDSDAAGFKIRGFIKSIVKNANVINIYIPDIYGKEKRKSIRSKEGKLGVEGIDSQILLDAFEKAGLLEVEQTAVPSQKITKANFYDHGLSGSPYAAEKRRKLIKALDLPEHLSANALLDVLNSLYSYKEYIHTVNTL